MCPNCNSPVPADAEFCTVCGTALRNPAAGASAPGQPGDTPGQYAQPTSPPAAPYGQPPPGQYGQPTAQMPSQYSQPASGQVRPAGSAPAYKFDINRLDVADRVIAGASLLLFISVFLPWFGLSILGSTLTVSGLTAHGYLWISMLTALALIGYLAARAGLDTLKLPIGHTQALLGLTALQLLIVLIAFFDKPGGIGWQFGAFLGLLAALAACGIIVVPMIRAMQSGTQR